MTAEDARSVATRKERYLTMLAVRWTVANCSRVVTNTLRPPPDLPIYTSMSTASSVIKELLPQTVTTHPSPVGNTLLTTAGGPGQPGFELANTTLFDTDAICQKFWTLSSSLTHTMLGLCGKLLEPALPRRARSKLIISKQPRPRGRVMPQHAADTITHLPTSNCRGDRTCDCCLRLIIRKRVYSSCLMCNRALGVFTSSVSLFSHSFTVARCRWIS